MDPDWMYEHFYNLSAEPFRLSPDHRFCYNHAKYAKAKAYMAYAFMRAEGFVLITGEPGTGKTTLVGDLIDTLADENVSVANLVSTQLAADDLLRMIAFAFGVDAEVAEKAVLLQQLTAHFLNLSRTGGRALLIVDEAQDLSVQALEELRLLTNLQEDGRPLLQIFLLGQTALQTLVHNPGLEQMHQRIVAASRMEALGEKETRAYVEHRLGVVGWQNNPAISAGVYPIIHLFSAGVPRRINLVCSRLFLHSAVEQRHKITVQDARTVVEELQDEQLSTRSILHHELFAVEDEFELVFLPEIVPEYEDTTGVVESRPGDIVEEVAEMAGSNCSDVNGGAPLAQKGPEPDACAPQMAPEILNALLGERVEGDELLAAVAANEAGSGITSEAAAFGQEPQVDEVVLHEDFSKEVQNEVNSRSRNLQIFAATGFLIICALVTATVMVCESGTSSACTAVDPVISHILEWSRYVRSLFV